ncbi:MAG: flagellar motor protein MotB [Syntrophobacteraceae bacterium]
MEDKPKVIIIKRVKKVGGGHHGGSWKVAYADFVTAMMAFFMVLWLLSMVSPEKRAVMSLYFKNFSLFDKGGKSFMHEGSFKPISQTGGQEYYETNEESIRGISEDELKGKMVSEMQQQFADMKETIYLEATDIGIRIQIVDRKENPIFPAGSLQLTEYGKKATKTVAGVLKGLPNKIIVEGHTDASQTKNEQVTNWELSSLRACTAMKELENNGIAQDKIVKVVGFANKVPFIKDDPDDPRNRRISILFLYNRKKQKASDPYDWMRTPPPHNIMQRKTSDPYDWVWKSPPPK